MPTLLSDMHHGQGEVRAHNLAKVRMLLQSLKGHVAGAGGNVQQFALRRKLGLPDEQFAPALILPTGHNSIHQIVAVGDAAKHLADILLFFGRSVKSHAEIINKPCPIVNFVKMHPAKKLPTLGAF